MQKEKFIYFNSFAAASVTFTPAGSDSITVTASVPVVALVAIVHWQNECRSGFRQWSSNRDPAGCKTPPFIVSYKIRATRRFHSFPAVRITCECSVLCEPGSWLEFFGQSWRPCYDNSWGDGWTERECHRTIQTECNLLRSAAIVVPQKDAARSPVGRPVLRCLAALIRSHLFSLSLEFG